MVASPSRGEIYQVNFDPTRGSEQSGIRPALVIQHDALNAHSPVTIVAAITSQRPKRPYPQEVELPATALPKPSWVLCNQVLTVSKSRLGKMMGVLDAQTMLRVDEALRHSLRLT